MRAAVLLPLLGALWVGPRPDGPAAAAATRTPAPGCAECHAAIHDEWRQTRHATAFTDPVYQAALRDLEDPARCHGCHAPVPVLARFGRPPRARTEDPHEGITCASCHATRRGIAGPFGAPTDAHVSESHPAFSEQGSVHLCSSCHDLRIGPVLPLGRDFREADLGSRGKSCVGCHMPSVRRPIANDPNTGSPSGPERRGRSHALRGPSDPDFAASAFKVVARPDGDRIELAVGNRAGHRIPGLESRRFEFAVIQRDEAGAEVGRSTVTFDAENPLRAAETRRFRFPKSDRAVRVDILGSHVHGSSPPTIFQREDVALRDRDPAAVSPRTPR
ncbi:MAG: hypothetical protein RL562_945 [Planctomycetota bacterium]|jgi:hypothetical protein